MATTNEERLAREQARRRRSIAGVLGIVVLMVVVGVVLARAVAPGSAEVTAPAAGQSEYGVTIGPEDAPRSVVVYEDFLCPFCGQLEAATHDRLAELADEGSVLVDYRPFVLLDADYSAQAVNAFKVVLDEAGPEVALDFHTALFEQQPEESGPYPDVDDLVDLAVSVGAAESAVRPGIEDETQAAWVEEATEAALDTGLEGTPTVLLDGVPFTDGDDVEDLAANLLAAVS